LTEKQTRLIGFGFPAQVIEKQLRVNAKEYNSQNFNKQNDDVPQSNTFINANRIFKLSELEHDGNCGNVIQPTPLELRNLCDNSCMLKLDNKRKSMINLGFSEEIIENLLLKDLNLINKGNPNNEIILQVNKVENEEEKQKYLENDSILCNKDIECMEKILLKRKKLTLMNYSSKYIEEFIIDYSIRLNNITKVNMTETLNKFYFHDLEQELIDKGYGSLINKLKNQNDRDFNLEMELKNHGFSDTYILTKGKNYKICNGEDSCMTEINIKRIELSKYFYHPDFIEETLYNEYLPNRKRKPNIPPTEIEYKQVFKKKKLPKINLSIIDCNDDDIKCLKDVEFKRISLQKLGFTNDLIDGKSNIIGNPIELNKKLEKIEDDNVINYSDEKILLMNQLISSAIAEKDIVEDKDKDNLFNLKNKLLYIKKLLWGAIGNDNKDLFSDVTTDILTNGFDMNSPGKLEIQMNDVKLFKSKLEKTFIKPSCDDENNISELTNQYINRIKPDLSMTRDEHDDYCIKSYDDQICYRYYTSSIFLTSVFKSNFDVEQLKYIINEINDVNKKEYLESRYLKKLIASEQLIQERMKSNKTNYNYTVSYFIHFLFFV
jgi:hypothetical protein